MPRFLVLALLTLSQAAMASDFNVEEGGLVEVPAEVDVAVIEFVGKPVIGLNGDRCELIGKQIDLESGPTSKDWVVTTKPPCAWAESAAPVWVVRSKPTGYSVVLSFETYELTIGKGSQHGLHNLATTQETAGLHEEQHWAFNGRAYVKTRENNEQPR